MSTKADLFHSEPGAVLQFRARARDAAGNVESWPGNPELDTSTRLYKRRVDGQIVDNRSISLPAVPYSIVPSPMNEARVDLQGKYQAWFAGDGSHTFSANHPGYGHSLLRN